MCIEDSNFKDITYSFAKLSYTVTTTNIVIIKRAKYMEMTFACFNEVIGEKNKTERAMVRIN